MSTWLIPAAKPTTAQVPHCTVVRIRVRRGASLWEPGLTAVLQLTELRISLSWPLTLIRVVGWFRIASGSPCDPVISGGG
jgi:hypothetical protein